MSKKNKSGYSKAVRYTCIALAGLTLLGIITTIIVYFI